MSSKILNGLFHHTPKTARTDVPATPAKNTAVPAKGTEKALDADGHYRNSFSAEGQVNKDYKKTYSHGDTSDLFTPNAKPSKLGGALSLLPTVTKEANFEKHAVGFQRNGSFNGLGGLAQGQGHISVGEAYVKAHGQVGIEGGAFKASGNAEASATLLDAQGSIHVGKGDYNLDAHGEAYVGARAKATGELTIDPAKGIYAAKVGGEAFAGARAGAEANVNLGQFGGVGARAEAWAGVGAAFHAEAGFKNGRFKAKFDIGAALGVGFKIGFNVDIDVKGIKNAVTKVLKAPVEAIKDVGKSIVSGLKKLKFW